ncbi:uncharacterized protein DDB_G0287625-like [Argopecten irradians]|uniref:uncharacterized protein DDB_G0287625-like n=1 Tax=Argopecten irradians TaxID=31199 RepID=UPI00371FF200
MAIQTQCCVLLVIFVTITAGVPVPSKYGGIAASSNCPPCRLPKSIEDSCIERILTRINTGELCLFCINRCRSTKGTSSVMSGTVGTSRSALTRNQLKTKSIVSTKSMPGRNKKSKSKPKRKSSKKSKSESKRKSSKRSKSESKRKSSRRRKNSKKGSKRSKSKTTSAKIATGMQAHVMENNIVTNTAIKPQKTPSLQLSYGESPPDKVASLVPSADTQMAQKGKTQRKKPKTLLRGSRVGSVPRQSRIIDPYADETLIQQGTMSRSYRPNRRYGGRRHRQMSYGRRMTGQGYYPGNYGYFNPRPRTWDDRRSYDDGYNARQTDDMSNDNDSGNDSGNDSRDNDSGNDSRENDSDNDSRENDSGDDSRENDSGDDYGRSGYMVPKRARYNANYRSNNNNFSSGGGDSGSSSENRSDR